MTTIVWRRRREQSPIAPAIRAARKVGESKLAGARRFLAAKEQKENKLNAAAIRRHAKRHGLELEYHDAPWTFSAHSGERIALPAGYFAVVDGIFEQIVVEYR